MNSTAWTMDENEYRLWEAGRLAELYGDHGSPRTPPVRPWWASVLVAVAAGALVVVMLRHFL